jgi:hypothetical protein
MIFTVLVGSLFYFGSHRNVLAQSSPATQAIVNATGCTLSADQQCTLTLNWPTGFADSSYAPVCTTTFFDNGSWTGQTLLQIESQTATSVTLDQFNNVDTNTVTTTVNCIGVHN